VVVVADPDPLAPVFASRRADGKIVVVALNNDPDHGLELKLDGSLCNTPIAGPDWTLSGADGLRPEPAPADAARYRLEPWSLEVIELNPARAQ